MEIKKKKRIFLKNDKMWIKAGMAWVSSLWMMSREIFAPDSIRHFHKPTCITCQHFIPTNRQCRLFGQKDIIQGTLHYLPASTVRSDEEQCGIDAKHYKKQHLWKIHHICATYKWWVLICMICCLHLFSLIAMAQRDTVDFSASHTVHHHQEKNRDGRMMNK